MDKTNKFLFTIRSLTGGGAERVVSVLSSKMAEDGYDVSIICYKSETGACGQNISYPRQHPLL